MEFLTDVISQDVNSYLVQVCLQMKQGFFLLQNLLISVDAQACKCKYYMTHTGRLCYTERRGKLVFETGWPLSVQDYGAEASRKSTTTRTSETQFAYLTTKNSFPRVSFSFLYNCCFEGRRPNRALAHNQITWAVVALDATIQGIATSQSWCQRLYTLHLASLESDHLNNVT